MSDTLSGPASAPSKGQFIPTAPETRRDYYASIQELSSGPIAWDSVPESDSLTGRMHRVAVLLSEIYDTVFLEDITFGVEGCCAKLRAVRRLDLDAFVQQFRFPGEVTGFVVNRWIGPDSFEFHFRDRHFRIDDVGRDTVRVIEIGAP